MYFAQHDNGAPHAAPNPQLCIHAEGCTRGNPRNHNGTNAFAHGCNMEKDMADIRRILHAK